MQLEKSAKIQMPVACSVLCNLCYLEGWVKSIAWVEEFETNLGNLEDHFSKAN